MFDFASKSPRASDDRRGTITKRHHAAGSHRRRPNRPLRVWLALQVARRAKLARRTSRLSQRRHHVGRPRPRFGGAYERARRGVQEDQGAAERAHLLRLPRQEPFVGSVTCGTFMCPRLMHQPGCPRELLPLGQHGQVDLPAALQLCRWGNARARRALEGQGVDPDQKIESKCRRQRLGLQGDAREDVAEVSRGWPPCRRGHRRAAAAAAARGGATASPFNGFDALVSSITPPAASRSSSMSAAVPTTQPAAPLAARSMSASRAAGRRRPSSAEGRPRRRGAGGGLDGLRRRGAQPAAHRRPLRAQDLRARREADERGGQRGDDGPQPRRRGRGGGEAGRRRGRRHRQLRRRGGRQRHRTPVNGNGTADGRVRRRLPPARPRPPAPIKQPAARAPRRHRRGRSQQSAAVSAVRGQPARPPCPAPRVCEPLSELRRSLCRCGPRHSPQVHMPAATAQADSLDVGDPAKKGKPPAGSRSTSLPPGRRREGGRRVGAVRRAAALATAAGVERRGRHPRPAVRREPLSASAGFACGFIDEGVRWISYMVLIKPLATSYK